MRNVASLALCLILFNGCVRVDGLISESIQGQVVDSRDESPLSDVVVELVDIGVSRMPGQSWATDNTDDGGRFHVLLETQRYGRMRLLPWTPLARDRCVIKVSKEGYQTKRIRLKGSESREELMVRLDRK